MWPIITRATEEILRLVPQELREGALALGLPRWKVILRIVVPTAGPGIFTAVMLAVARGPGRDRADPAHRARQRLHEHQPVRSRWTPSRCACTTTRRRRSLDSARRWRAAGAICLLVIVLALSITARVISSSDNRRRVTVNGVEVSGLNAWFGSNHVLHDVDMEARERTVTAIIGPSGCGKSTLIRCLNRMHEEVRGARVDRQGAVRRPGHLRARQSTRSRCAAASAWCSSAPNPFPTMSVLENAVAGLKLGATLSKAELRERGERALRRAGLWDEVKDRLDEPGGRLSGGQQQRLCIARALAVEPEVLLMDEPASALDPASTLRIEELVEELKETVHGRHRHAQHAAGGPRRGLDDVHAERRGGRSPGRPSRIFTNPDDKRTEDYVTGRFG